MPHEISPYHRRRINIRVVSSTDLHGSPGVPLRASEALGLSTRGGEEFTGKCVGLGRCMVAHIMPTSSKLKELYHI
jgi:hypothetical protein